MFEPITDSVKTEPLAKLPAAALEGESELIEATGSDAGAVKNVKLAEADVDARFDTVMLADPAKAMSAYVMAACSSVALTKVVGRGAPFQFTTVSGVKVVPVAAVTSSVKPDALQYGVEFVVDGIPSTNAAPMLRGKIVKFAVEMPPPGGGVVTVTATVPGAPSTGLGALSWVEFR